MEGSVTKMDDPAIAIGDSVKKDNRMICSHGLVISVPVHLSPAIKNSHSDTSVSVKPSRSLVSSGIRVLIAQQEADTPTSYIKDSPIPLKDVKAQNKKKSNTGQKMQKTSANYASTVKNIFDVHLAHLTELKSRAQNDIPDPPQWLIMVLQMPRVIKVFHFIRYRRHKFEKLRSFIKWYNVTVEQYNKLLDIRQAAAILIQKRHRGYRTRCELWTRRCALLAEFNKAARVLQICLRAVVVRKRIEERKRKKILPIIILIQSVVRMFVYRRRYLQQLRKKLYRALRAWSEGRIHNLLRRPGILFITTGFYYFVACF